MKISKDERHTLRELAKRSMELASLPLQAERKARAKDINDLKRRRPIVWLNEIPWHEMDIDGKLVCVCEDAFARGMERHFRQTLYRWEYIQADTVVEGWYPIGKAYSSTGLGVEVKENIIPSDEKNHIVSHGYIDQLDSLEAVAKIKDPVIKADREQDAKHLEWAADILDGIMDAKLCGNYIYHAPWDTIPRLHGVENVMSDLIDRPELMHAAVRRFTEAGISQMRQMEAEGLLGNEKQDVHCTPAYSSETVPKPETKLKDIWFRGMAQMFSDVSPAMWDEFDLQYMKPLMAECALTYYGCCESLDKKIPLLKSVPNLRKIGVSPWANPEVCAELIGGGYVYAHKPNPARVSGAFDAEAVRGEISRVIETCQRHGCPFEFVLKDISTVSYKPGNMIEWVKTVMGTIDGFYK